MKITRRQTLTTSGIILVAGCNGVVSGDDLDDEFEGIDVNVPDERQTEQLETLMTEYEEDRMLEGDILSYTEDDRWADLEATTEASNVYEESFRVDVARIAGFFGIYVFESEDPPKRGLAVTVYEREEDADNDDIDEFATYEVRSEWAEDYREDHFDRDQFAERVFNTVEQP